MNIERRRHGRGEWITRHQAAICAPICYALFALLAWMLLNPKAFFDFVMGIGL